MDNPIVTRIQLLRDRVSEPNIFPFTLPLVRRLDSVSFSHNVTFIVGENGCGKSTLLEALAISCGFNPEGGGKNLQFSSHAAHSGLHSCLRVTKSRYPADGYFYRSDSFYNVASMIDQLDSVPAPGRKIIESYGGTSLHNRSHAESLMLLMTRRFSGDGLYIMDEPESGLSPTTQMAFLVAMDELVRAGAQFVIATHAPMLLCYPHAVVLQVADGTMTTTAADQTEHVRLSAAYFADPERYLRSLGVW